MTNNKFVRGLFLSTVALMFTLVACQEENVVSTQADVDTFTTAAVVALQDSAQCGKHGCFEFVFPLGISFPDGAVSEVGDYDEMRAAISAWKELNPDATERPGFVYPIEVISEDGEVTSVASSEELRELRRECGRGFRGRGKHKGRNFTPCFSIVYPVTVEFPDGSTEAFSDRESLKAGLRAWKEANPDAETRPEVVFPLTVEYEDGSTATAESKEALRALKETCQEESDQEDS
ncbi:MAG: hypothetical protein AAF694_07140 [Bacteroidota bacterium]